VRAVRGQIQTNLLHPAIDDPSVLTRGQVRRLMKPTWEKKVLRLEIATFDPPRHRFSGLYCDLELDWPLGLLLHDDRTSRDAISVCYVPDP